MQQIGTLMNRSSVRREKKVLVAFKFEDKEILLWIKN